MLANITYLAHELSAKRRHFCTFASFGDFFHLLASFLFISPLFAALGDFSPFLAAFVVFAQIFYISYFVNVYILTSGVRDVIGRMETTPGSKRGKQRGRAAFFANIAAIREALEAGAHLTEIHQQHAGQLGIGYSQFCKYVRKHITGKKREAEADAKGRQHSAMAGTQNSGAIACKAHKAVEQRQLPAFDYDPMDAYRKPE